MKRKLHRRFVPTMETLETRLALAVVPIGPGMVGRLDAMPGSFFDASNSGGSMMSPEERDYSTGIMNLDKLSSFQSMPLPNHGDGEAKGPAGDVVSLDLATRTETVTPFKGATTNWDPVPGGMGTLGTKSSGEPQGAENFTGLNYVPNPEDFPWRTNVKVFMTFPNGQGYQCSGTLIDPMHVLTAGHCVYGASDGGWATSVQVIPGFENGSQPFGSGFASGSNLHSWQGWTQSADWDHDLGIVDLDRPVGALTGWQGYHFSSSPSFFTGGNFHNAGYPGDTPFDGNYMYYRNGSFDATESFLGVWYGNEVRIDSQSWGGQSGSGAYVLNGNSRTVYAALSNGNSSETWFVRITDDKYSEIRDQIIGTDTPAAVDLMPLAVNLSSSSFQAGVTTANLSYVVHNYSTANWNGSVNARVYLSNNNIISGSDQLLGTHTLSGDIGSMGSAIVDAGSLSIPGDVVAGNYWIGIVLDSADANFGNNDSSGQDAFGISVTSAPPCLLDGATGAINAISTVAATIRLRDSGEKVVTCNNQFIGSTFLHNIAFNGVGNTSSLTIFDDTINTPSRTYRFTEQGFIAYGPSNDVIYYNNARVVALESFFGNDQVTISSNGSTLGSMPEIHWRQLSGVGTMILDDSGSSAGREYALTDVGLAIAGLGDIAHYQGEVEAVALNTSQGGTTTRVGSNAVTLGDLPQFTIHGGLGTDNVILDDSGYLAGRSYFMTEVGLAIPGMRDVAYYDAAVEYATLRTANGPNTTTVGSNARTLFARPRVSVVGGPGADEVILEDSGSTTDRDYILTEIGVAIAGIGDYAYYQNGIENVTLKTGSATNLIRLSSNSHALKGLPTISILGGTGLDQINFDDTGNPIRSAFAVASHGIGVGSVTSPALPFSGFFGGMEYINLVLGCGSTVNSTGWNPAHFQLGVSCTGQNDGDFNNDGVYNLTDIDGLMGAIAAGVPDPVFDLTNDGLLNLADRDAWLAEAGAINLGPGRVYRLGDANLDRFVDGTDFGSWNSHKFTNVAAWSAGDFNGDGFVDGSDFGIWNSNKFTSADSGQDALRFAFHVVNRNDVDANQNHPWHRERRRAHDQVFARYERP